MNFQLIVNLKNIVTFFFVTGKVVDFTKMKNPSPKKVYLFHKKHRERSGTFLLECTAVQ